MEPKAILVAILALLVPSISFGSLITEGSWAIETHSDGCVSLSLEPIVTGFNLGQCVGNATTASTSIKYTSCQWSGDMTQLTVSFSTYDAGYCTGAPSNDTSIYSGLNASTGCAGVVKYQCGPDIGYSMFGSPQHIGHWNTGACGTDGDEAEWSVLSYDSCSGDSGCIISSSSHSTKALCDDPISDCFHVKSIIDYKGIQYTYEELMAGEEPECTVPHSPTSKGLVISTTCDKAVRVTDTHLMATAKGFQLAYSLKAGDVLFGDYDNKEMCIVQSVEKEKTTQQYFGLNCVHSEVLVSGLRASTFGDFHTLPSWYMTYVGSLVGTGTASSLGEYIAEWFFQM